MPTHQNNNEKSTKPKKPISDRNKNTPIINLSVNTDVNQVTLVNPRGAESGSQNDSVTINVVSAPNDYTHDIAANDIARAANKISNKSYLINTGLFLGTIVLAIIGIYQYRSSQSAAVTAKETLDSTNTYNSRMFKMQQEANKSADKEAERKRKIDSQTFKLQQKALNQQIASLKETQKEFEIESRPFIAIGNFMIDTPQTGKNMNYSALVGNAGKQPAYITKCGFAFVPSLDSAFCDFKRVPEQAGHENEFLPNSQNFPIVGESKNKFDKPAIDFLIGKKLYVYLIGYCKYTGFNKKKIYSLKFCYRMEANRRFSFKTVYYSLD